MLRRILPLIALLLLIIPAQAQEDDGRGVVVIPLPDDPQRLGLVTPSNCFGNLLCELLNELLLPHLQAVDPQTGRVVRAAPDNYSLTESIEVLDDHTAVFTLRDDLTWSNGTPVTAYDAFYSHSTAGLPGHITLPLDETRLAVVYDDPLTCAVLDRLALAVVPAPSALLDEIDGAIALGDDPRAQYTQLTEDLRFVPINFGYQQVLEAGITAGPFTVEEVLPLEAIHLRHRENGRAVSLRDLPLALSPVEALVEEQTSLLLDVPYGRPDLLTHSELQIASQPSRIAYYLAFNLADPVEPVPAFERFTGEPLEQGVHPITGDPTVRQAIRLGLDVQRLIDVAANGHGTPLAGSQPPSSWTASPNLTPPTFDPRQARRLLEDAGWRDSNGDGRRECVRCAFAEPDQPLYLRILAGESQTNRDLANEISRQLGRVGILVEVVGFGPENARFQNFDMVLDNERWSFPYAPDYTDLLRENDIPGEGLNVTSYASERFESLYAEAETLDDCDPERRAPLYHEIETLLAEDLPRLYLFAPDRLIAAQDDVRGFDPLPYAPFWNIARWNVLEEVQR